jgi:hypothetical protein
MGTPINAIDALCMAHDLNFGKTGADWTNMQSEANWNKLRPDQQKQVQQYNQQLCDGVAKASVPWWNASEGTAAWEIGVFFHSHVPKGAQCH